jgi:hypothetical protein
MNKQEALKRIEAQKETIIRLTGWAVYVYIEELIKSIDEPKKVVVPQFVADWIEYFKKCSGTLYGSTVPYSYYGHTITDDFEGDVTKVLEWIRNNSETYARAWLDGYEVEKEPKYTVKIKATKHYFAKDGNGRIFFSLAYKSCFTQTELEKAGFGWVFDCEGIEIEEVEE